MAPAIRVTHRQALRLARVLEPRTPAEILEWAARRFGRRVALGTGFGPEGCVLIDLIGRHRLPIDVFTLDTGLLFPETYALWRELEARYHLVIRAIRPSETVEEQAARLGSRLWEREPDLCCHLRKVRPLQAALANLDAWITGIRRDQTQARASARVVERDARFDRVKINPLVRWTSEEVWAYVEAHRVPVNSLHEQGYPSVGCTPCTTPVGSGEDARAGRWRGWQKTECGLHDRPTLVQPAGVTVPVEVLTWHPVAGAIAAGKAAPDE